MRHHWEQCGNPCCRIFHTDRELPTIYSATPGAKPYLMDKAGAASQAVYRALTDIPGVTDVSTRKYEVSITRGAVFDWREICCRVEQVMASTPRQVPDYVKENEDLKRQVVWQRTVIRLRERDARNAAIVRELAEKSDRIPIEAAIEVLNEDNRKLQYRLDAEEAVGKQLIIRLDNAKHTIRSLRSGLAEKRAPESDTSQRIYDAAMAMEKEWQGLLQQMPASATSPIPALAYYIDSFHKVDLARKLIALWQVWRDLTDLLAETGVVPTDA